MSEELKPCPFCGGKAELIHTHTFSEQSHIRCVKCSAKTREFAISTRWSSDQKAIEAWNRRCEDDIVVRCKDCKYYNEYENGEKIIGEEEVHDGWCMRWSGIENVNRHDYCSYGERAEA